MRLVPSLLFLSLLIIDNAVCLWDSAPQADAPQRNKKTRNRPTSDDDEGRPSQEPCASDRDVCSNFHASLAKMINQQITEELKASYTYQSMAYYFGRDDVALRGFSKFFQAASDEERDHAQIFMKYINQRGGDLILSDIPKPEVQEWETGLDAVRAALALEHHVNNKLLDLHWMAQQRNDPHLQDFLEGTFLTEQVDSIKQLADWVTILDRVRTTPLGQHMFDQELNEGKR